MSDCVFCKISGHEQEAEIVYEDEEIIAFNDINPSAPVHILVVPKKHIDSIAGATAQDADLLGRLIFRAKEIASQKGLSGYKLVFNVGKEGGQIIYHLHLHLLGNEVNKNKK